ncbi:unnamed protein product [Stenotrophomonas maltophilia]|nr:unnamed protein product [Stenotrophomonas maltophilia]
MCVLDHYCADVIRGVLLIVFCLIEEHKAHRIPPIDQCGQLEMRRILRIVTLSGSIFSHATSSFTSSFRHQHMPLSYNRHTKSVERPQHV